MNITYVITNLATGGAEMMLLKLLQNINRSRFQITVISMIGEGEVGAQIAGLGIPVYTLGMKRMRIPNPIAFFRLVCLLRVLQPDIVHTWMYHADFLGGLAARVAGFKRVVWCVRNSDLDGDRTSKLTFLVVKACALVSSWLPIKIISCSDRAKKIHVSIGYDEAKFEVIPNGFDLNRFVPSVDARVDVRVELGLVAEIPLVGLIARYDPQKNHMGFVQAAARVVQSLPQVHFVLVGKDVDYDNIELKNAIESLGLKNCMHLLNLRNDVPRLMASLDVLASSSSFGEAFPNVLGEAMACGVPCVVTDVGDSAEIVGGSGRTVPAEDMARLANEIVVLLQMSLEEKAALGREARCRVAQHYEISHVAALYEACYQRVAVGLNTVGHI